MLQRFSEDRAVSIPADVGLLKKDAQVRHGTELIIVNRAGVSERTYLPGEYLDVPEDIQEVAREVKENFSSPPWKIEFPDAHSYQLHATMTVDGVVECDIKTSSESRNAKVTSVFVTNPNRPYRSLSKWLVENFGQVSKTEIYFEH